MHATLEVLMNTRECKFQQLYAARDTIFIVIIYLCNLEIYNHNNVKVCNKNIEWKLAICLTIELENLSMNFFYKLKI